jgi:hypothetical protein
VLRCYVRLSGRAVRVFSAHLMNECIIVRSLVAGSINSQEACLCRVRGFSKVQIKQKLKIKNWPVHKY